ncbi:cytochrome P450 [Xylaria palmicola]|nr:cytochrome P450 [Xylaria palmicola]
MAVVPVVSLAALLVYYLYVKLAERRRIPPGARPLPGPKCYPIVGRFHDVPKKGSWLKFYEWSKEFGPIYQTSMFGTVHVWISSERVAHDLLSKRSGIYSDRPLIPNLPDNRTKGDYLALTGHNDIWRRQRKLAKQLMSSNSSLHDYPSKERDRFLYLLANDPSQYREYIEQFTARTVARLCWGSPRSAQRLRVTTAGLLETISPAGALPNMVSWLMHLPTCMSPWQQKENARHAVEAQLLRDNVRHVHERVADGTADPSLMRTFVENANLPGAKPFGVGEDEASYVVAQMAIAGALTIGSPIQSYLLAMLHYPSWQGKLQAEIERVCGGACPQWEHRQDLPMLRAVVKEVIRWRPPVPTGIPHAIEKDDVYNGYFIPAGATVHALEWAMTRDETVYPDCDTFNPARWLEPQYPTYREPLTEHPKLSGFSQFGFGRRTCQGLPLVEQDLFLAMGGMAWALDVRRKRRPGAGAGEVPVHWNDYTPLLIAKPEAFEFDAVVRDEERLELLRRMWEAGKDEDEEVDEDVNRGETEKRRRRRRGEEKGSDEYEDEDGSDTSGLGNSTSSESLGSCSSGDSLDSFSSGQSDSDTCDLEWPVPPSRGVPFKRVPPKGVMNCTE